MASNSDVQYVAYLKAKFNLADADLLQVIALSQRTKTPEVAADETEGDDTEEVVEESYEEEEEVAEGMGDSGYEEVVEDDYEDEEVVEYMDESYEEQVEDSSPRTSPSDEQRALAAAPVPAPFPAPGQGAVAEAPSPSNAMVAYEGQEAPEDEYAASVKMPDTIVPEPRQPEEIVEIQDEGTFEKGDDEEKALAIEQDSNNLAIVPSAGTAMVPASVDEEAGNRKAEPPLPQEPEEEEKEDNTMVLVAAVILLLLVIGGVVVIILIFVTDTIPVGGDPDPVVMSPPQPGNCNFEGQMQPNVISQCACNNQVSTVADYTRERYDQLSTEFITPTVYSSWNLGINSCEPANLALLWLSTGPEIEDETALLQRYILAYLYYSTQGERWTRQSNWMGTGPECSWFGVTCSGSNLQRITLLNNTVNGQIPTELALLTQLNTISLDQNNIARTIPTNIFTMSSLRTLTLGVNRLTGTIPTQVGQATGLTTLRLNGNLYRGTIPTQLNRLTRLQSLSLANNTMLTGRIPSEIGRFTSLQSLSLSSTGIRAVIPSEYGNLRNLNELRIANTLVGGLIPVELASLTNLQIMDFNGSRFRKTIPTFLGGFTDLTMLMLGNNEIEGPIPSELGRLTNLQVLELHNNTLSGPLPVQLGNLTSLVNMTLQGNPLLSGNAPAEVCSLVSTGSLENFTSDCPTRNFGILCPIPTCCTACVSLSEDLDPGIPEPSP